MDTTSSYSELGPENPALSVVIGIRNWGLDRLEVAIRSHLTASIRSIEVVISDYGSENHDQIREIARKLGCKYVYTAADVWSRSAALNAGVRIASSDIILTTDADIIFSPKAHEVLLYNLSCMPDSVQIIQCRDLPEGFGAESLSSFDWDRLFSVSSIRPRWGMGGSATFTKALFSRLHGFEERMTVWGGEDNDFVQRARRSGAILNWIENPEAQIYHIWHPPDSRGTSPAGTKIVEQNKKILQEDHTIVRNLARSYRGPKAFIPTVSIVVPARGRPDLLRESISSCLAQTFQDFEIIVVGDMSSDAVEPVLQGFDDPRIRLLRLDGSGGDGFARNCANAVARGEFIAIHDGDDLMLPRRLEHQLGAIIDDFAGSYGGCIDFDDDTGRLMLNPGRKVFDQPSMMYGKTPAHGTILIRRQVLAHYRYNENLPAHSDYHLLNRIARGGVRLAHCGHYIALRRLQAEDWIEANSSVRKTIAGISKAMARGTLSANVDQQYRRSSRANLPVEIGFPEIMEAVRHLPPRLLEEKVRLEFHTPLPATSGGFEALAAAITSYRSANIEFSRGAPHGIKAVTIPSRRSGTRDHLISAFCGIGEIESVGEVMLPAAYPDLSALEEELQAVADGEKAYLDIGIDVEGVLQVVGKHSNRCFLSANEKSGYRLGLPSLGPTVEALVRTKLARFLDRSRIESGG